jgi:ABC-type sugar transport system permease subunit
MSRQQRRDRLIFLAPSMTVLAVILFYPLLYSVGLSFYNYYLPVPRKTFVGLDNFRYIWSDDAFWDALGVWVQAAWSPSSRPRCRRRLSSTAASVPAVRQRRGLRR